MNKEIILEELKDLVNTLRSPNIREENIIQLWREKRIKVDTAVRSLATCDQLWLSDEYGKWYREEISPKLTGIQSQFAMEENFPWI